ncbi:MAG: Rieske (2Fe-2S) protein [Mycobacteriales bacterium]
MTEHVVCDAQEVPPGGSSIVTIGKLEFGIYNIDGEYVAVRNLCPHAGAPLCRGVLTGMVVSDGPGQRRWEADGKILRCPWHGWEFRLPEGETVAQPAIKVLTYPAHEQDGKIVVSLPVRPAARAAAEVAR